ncbi:dihydroorotase [Spirochaeta thermophila DSM 6192]|uniref:Dihydroorotase n=2 Tax=Winmispira thermophila TaxID=154 RepID=E0RQD1_WINT6|nr:dihydroorotase [Spirochaeta thermophila DSM 6192]
MHLHLRQGAQLVAYARDAARSFARGLVMPNTLPPLASPESVRAYGRQIEEAAPGFTPLLTFKILPHMDAGLVRSLKEAGAVAGKLYPEGVTTHAEDGVRDVEGLFPVFEAMAEEGLVLCIHAESPGAPVLEREAAFHETFLRIHHAVPSLRIVFEHVSDARTVALIRTLPPDKVAGTITLHHLLFTLDDLLGGRLNPHLFCKPVVKTSADRDALREAAFSGDPHFFFGSDSAPHPREKKEREGAAGCYTAPYALEALASLFEAHGVLGVLEGFVSERGARFYGLLLNEERVVLRKEEWVVPAEYHGVVPACAGMRLGWRVVEKGR